MSMAERGDSMSIGASHQACIIDFQDDVNSRRVQNLFMAGTQNERTKSSWDDLAFQKYRMDQEENESDEEPLMDIFALSSNSTFSQKLDLMNPAGCFKMASLFDRMTMTPISTKTTTTTRAGASSIGTTTSTASHAAAANAMSVTTSAFDSPEYQYLKVTPVKARSKMIGGQHGTATSVTSFSSTLWSGFDTRNGSDCSSDCEEKGPSENGSMTKLDSPNKTTDAAQRRRTVRLIEAVEEMWNRPCHINPPQCRTLLYTHCD